MTDRVLIKHKRSSVKGKINVTLSRGISYCYLLTSHSVRTPHKSSVIIPSSTFIVIGHAQITYSKCLKQRYG